MRVRFGFDFEEAGRASGLNILAASGKSAASILSPAAVAPVLLTPEASTLALSAPKLASDGLPGGLSPAAGEAYVVRPFRGVVDMPATVEASDANDFTGSAPVGCMCGLCGGGGGARSSAVSAGSDSNSVMGSSGPGLTVRLSQYFDAVDNRYEFSGNQDIDAVLIGSKWNLTTLTYSFPTSGAFYQTPYYDSGYLTNHVVFNAAQQNAVRYSLGLIYGYTLLTFNEVTETNTTHANLRFSQTTDASLGSAEGNFPGSDSWDGDIWFGQTGQPFYLTPAIGNWGQATIMHEIGHALGLKHGHQDYTNFDLSPGGYVDGPGPRYGTRALDASHDSWAYSLMTYRSASGYAADFQGDEFNQPQTYMQNDIAALQYMYGAYFGHNSGNTVYTFNITTGEMFINGVGQGTPTLNGGQGKIFRTIWDGNGTDTYDFSNFTGNQTINLSPGAWSTMSTARLVDLRPLDGGVNVAGPGNIANALLYNNDTRSLIENANGGIGNDSIYGNVANNSLVGNDGNDYLDGWTGNDTLNGGNGDDNLLGYTGNDSLQGGEGDDSLYGEGDNDTLDGWIGNDYLSGAGGNDTMLGYTGDDTISGGDGDDSMNGEGGLDSMAGGLGNDTYNVDNIGDVVSEAASAGTDLVRSSITYTLGADLENLTLTGLNINGTGNSLANLITGSSGNNVLAGGGGFDTINGGSGNDVIYSTGFGFFSGEADNDTVWIANGFPETLDGGTEVDLLEASTATFAYAINLATGVTNFASESFVNFENLNSGSGDDTLVGTSGDNVINGGAGNDNIDASSGSDTVNGQAGDDYLYTAAFSNKTYDGGTGNDTIGGGFQYGNTWDGGADTDTLVMTLHDFGPATVNLVAGTYTTVNGTLNVLNFENYTGHNDVEIITGTTGANVILAEAGDDDIDGNGGNDTVDGGAGNDYLHSSGAGIVNYSGGTGNDTITGTFNYTSYIDGGADVDTLDLAYIAGGVPPIVFDMATGVYTDGSGNLTLLNFENYLGQGAAETVGGTAGENLIEGNNGNDSITGLAGNDTLNGGAGNDTIDAGAVSDGTDSVDGGSGNDVITSSGQGNYLGGTGNDYMYAGLTDFEDEVMDGGSGTDTLDTTLYSGDYAVNMLTGATNYGGESYINFEHAIMGAGNDTISGTNVANRIETGAGNDNIDGLAGADTLVGGTGDDTYYVNTGVDVVIEVAGEGTDTVVSAVSYTLAGMAVETLVLTGSANLSGTGNGLTNTLYGNTGNNLLDGGSNNDTAYGGAGNDTYLVGAAGDVVVEFAGEGTDLVEATVTHTLSADVENLTLTGAGNINGTGNALGNILTGNSGNNALAGGLGDDTYYVQNVGDSVVEHNGEGSDTLYSSVSWTIVGYVESLILTGGGNIDGIGNSISNAITGNTGANDLVGGGGHDMLDGGAGSDTLTGNTGDDTYYVDNVGDRVFEANGEGNADVIMSSVTYGLAGRYIETLMLTGTANIDGTGNSLSQSLIGNTGNNLLTALGGNDLLDGGAGGADTLLGGTGNDTYVAGAGDTLTENANEGTDLVESAITWTLGADFENLTLTGAANVNGTGNALNNVLTGNSGTNTLTGGLGDDSYYVQNATDVVTEGSNAGIDTVFSTVTWSIAAKQIENITLLGAAAIDAIGNNLSNILTGNDGVNTLDGSGGHDRLDGGLGGDNLLGGAGNDTYVVDEAGDTVTEAAGGGTDLVESAISYTLGANVEQVTLTGSAAINATGNDLSNVLTGNTGNNSLTGGLGNDTYYVQNAGDDVNELNGQGADAIFSTVSYSLSGRYVETLTLTGSANINATGNNLAQSLNGNSGNNTINSLGGADVITGGLGADIFLFQAASGADTITDFSGAQNDTININAYTGGVANNALVTQSGANVLISLGGGNVITVLSATQADVLAHMVW